MLFREFIFCLSGIVGVYASKALREPAFKDPCAISARSSYYSGVDSELAAGLYWDTVDVMKKCMNNLRITHLDASWTLKVLLYGVVENYSFTHIAVDSLAAEQTNKCGYKVHEVKVDLRALLERLSGEYTRTLAAFQTQEDQAKYLQKSRNAAHFHGNLTAEMNKLHDAHTIYYGPITQFAFYLPIGFKSKMRHGKQIITLKLESFGDLAQVKHAYQKVYRALPTKHSDGDVIAKINNLDPIVWMKRQVADDGVWARTYQDAAQRITSVFFKNSPFAHSATDNVEKLEELHIEFEDGTRETIYWIGQFRDPSNFDDFLPSFRNSEVLNDVINMRGKRFEAAINFYGKFWGIRAYGRLQMLKSQPDEEKSKVKDYVLSHNKKTSHLTGYQITKLYHTRMSSDSYPSPVHNNNNPDFPNNPFENFWMSGVGIEYMLFKRNTIILKIPTFEISPGGESSDYFVYFEDMPKVQKFARENNATRLLIDVSDNGGGYVSAANAMLYYLVPEEYICAPVSKSLTENSKMWVESFGTEFDRLIEEEKLEQPAKVLGSKDYIEKKFDELSLIIDFIEEAEEIELTHVRDHLLNNQKNIMSRNSYEERADALIEFMKNRKYFGDEAYDRLVGTHGMYPFDSVENSVVGTRGEYFPTPLEQYRSPVTKRWGRATEYSRKGDFKFCWDDILEGVPEMLKKTEQDYDRTYWTEIAFLSDGNCGSACALFTQNLQSAGIAASFSYAGIAGEPLDVASFAGGNVVDSDSTWLDHQISAATAHTVTFGRSHWSKINRDNEHNRIMPFPNIASARFNWNMMFAPPFGEDALPRQFYIVPADAHFNIWPSSQDEYMDLYDHVVKSDWEHVKANPQFPDSGRCEPVAKIVDPKWD